MKKITFIFTMTLLLSSLYLNAAVTIDTSLVSDNVKYELLITIPDDYDVAQEYPLVVCLQPCNGATVESFSNGLKPITDSLKMIVVCPGVLKYSGGWLGDDQWDIITASLDSAKAMYKIDTHAVYLNGMSCNGYYSLRKGLKKIYPFKGIFPYAPYMSSVNPNEIDLDSDMPVTIAVGTKDEYSYNPILNLFDSLKNHGANVNLILIPDITHTFSFANFGNEMIHSLLYLNDTNLISIKYSETELPDFEMLDTDEGKELVFKVAHMENRELIINSLSSNVALIANPDITFTPTDSTVKLNFIPQVGKAGQAVIILEVHEKDGMAIEQVTFKVKVTKVVGFDNIKNTGLFEIYPNPASNYVTINSSEAIGSIELLDITGKVLISETIQSNTFTINVESYTKGIYFIKMTNTDFSETHKIIIQ
jgi:hypothetical protein